MNPSLSLLPIVNRHLKYVLAKPSLLKYLNRTLFWGMILFTGSASAQNYRQLNHQIDSLDGLKLPKSALVEVDKLDQLALRNKDVAQQVRATIYRMKFQSYLEENALVPIIDTLKRSIGRASYPLKPVLQSLLAGMYWNYYQQYRWQISQRSHLDKAVPDITKWDLPTINTEMTNLFRQSLQDYQKEQATPIGILEGVLDGEKSTRYLRPTLYDLLVQRALAVLLSDEPALTKPKLPFALNNPLLFGDSGAFASLQLTTTDTSSTFYQGLKYLQQATLFHLQRQDGEALADLDLKRLEFLNRHATVDHQDELYFNALKQVATKLSAKAISADALVLQGKYYYEKDSLKLAYSYFTKAVSGYPGSFGSTNAAGYLKLIDTKQLTATVEDVNIPDKPLLGLLGYRNVKTARLNIFKISTNQYNELAKIPSDNNRYIDGVTIFASDSVLRYLKKLKPVQDEQLQLPDPHDYRSHSTEFKINALKSGHYVAVLKDELSDDPALIQLTAFKVCHLACLSRKITDAQVELRIVDRKTGAAVPGVSVTLAEAQHKVSDHKGACLFDWRGPNPYSVKLTLRADTLYIPSRYSYGAVPTSKTEARTLFFTDRQIYRPGQIVYYKGLQIEVGDSKNTIVTGQKLTVDIKDINGKQISSIPQTTNDFGTFSGTFTIPQNILNGTVQISTVNGNKYIRVEEYKRPSFYISFPAVRASYKPGDSVKIKGSVTTFSGYGLSQASVAYHITRHVNLKNYKLYSKYSQLLYRQTIVVNDTIKTDDQGKFEIRFKAGGDRDVCLADLNYSYTVNADITDGSGETQSANTWVNVGQNNFNLHTYVAPRVFARDSITTRVTNLNNAAQSAVLNLKIYLLKPPAQGFKARLWNMPDQFLISKADFKNNYPDYAYGDEDDQSTWPVQKKVAEIQKNNNVDKDFTSFKLDLLSKQPTGTYKMVMTARNERGDTTAATTYTYYINQPGKPGKIESWVIPLVTKCKPGQFARILVGTGQANRVLMEKYNGAQLRSAQWLDIPAGKQQLVKIPVELHEANTKVDFLMVYQNRVYTTEIDIANTDENQDLDIRFLTFRNKLQPGEKEQWKLQVSGKNKEQQVAEMVAGLYDASLDAIAGNAEWPNLRFQHGTRYFSWSITIADALVAHSLKYSGYYFNIGVRDYETLDMLGYNYYGRFNYGYRMYAKARVSMDTSKYETNAVFNDVLDKSELKEVVIGYGTMNAKSVVGAQSGVVRELHIKPGQKFSKEALAPSALGLVTLGDFQEQAVLPNMDVNPRKNFNETAFFYPQLLTNEKGEILVEFTMPEALTKWRFKAFAHTQDLKTGYIESEIVTQKQLSISANAPRFLREGDTITLSARLANLTGGALKGKVRLQLFNALNMQPVALLLNPADVQQAFDLAPATNKAVSFKLFVPAGLDALTYRLSADAGTFTDGEENTIPVLPNRMLVTESMPMMVRPGQTRLFMFDKLLKQNSTTLQNKTLTLEYTQNPAWYALQALPYLMEFPYECSEQIFSRYYANSMATSLVGKLPAIKTVFDRWKAANSPELLSNLEKNPELKATLIDETPWLRDAINEAEQKKRIALLFDLNKMSYELQANLNKLKQRQLANGGFPWFGGDQADQYITRHILSGMGQLYHSGIVDIKNEMFKDIADKAMGYLEHQLTSDAEWAKKHDQYDGRTLSAAEIHAYYTLSYFTAPTHSPEMQALLANYLNLAETEWRFKDVYQEAMIALTMQRNKRPEVAQKIVRSLMETAQHTDEMGMYWPKNQLGYFWYQAPVETQSLMIELFTELGNQNKAVDEMKLWLLRQKQTNNWKTTKATAAACYALLLKGDNLLADGGTSVIKIDGKLIDDLKPGLKADPGTGYIKTNWADEQVKPGLGKVSIQNNSKTISWGALHWQYLEKLDKIRPSQTDIQLERKYFIQKQTDSGPVLTAVDATHQPQTGDLLKVVVYLKAGRDFEYIQLKDMRPAGTEPVDVLSGYKYQDGLYYYQVTKDVATNFFISTLNKGSYVFEYRLRVAQPSNFATGISTVQCMYAPEFNAHSEGARMIVK